MLDQLFQPQLPDIVAGQKIAGRVDAVYMAPGNQFQTRAIDSLPLTFEGIEADFHAGYTRRSGGREPWYKRGTEMRNERQLSIVAPDEMAIVARRMDLPEVLPEWIGANLLLSNIPQLSMLPSGTLLFFEGGVTLKVDAQNGPCRDAGRSIGRNAGTPDVDATSHLFPQVAKRLRGLVAWVEKPGTIRSGETVSAKIPEQWIYRG